MHLKILVKQLPLKHTFTIAHQSRDVQDTIIVQLADGEYFGLGECTTNPFYGITSENIILSLERIRQVLALRQWENPEALWQMGQEIFINNPFAQAALDIAAWHLCAKRQGNKPYELLNLERKNMPTTNLPIAIASIQKMVAKMKELEWP